MVTVGERSELGRGFHSTRARAYGRTCAGILALDRDAAHLSEQLALKAFVPVVALSRIRRSLRPMFRGSFDLPATTTPAAALHLIETAARKSGANPERLRDVLASGDNWQAWRFCRRVSRKSYALEELESTIRCGRLRSQGHPADKEEAADHWAASFAEKHLFSLRQVVAERRPEHVVDALGADAANARPADCVQHSRTGWL